MNNDVVRLFHELWLGMVQPIEGLVVSVPVLLNAQCYERQPPSTHRLFLELCSARRPDSSHAQAKNGDSAPGSPRVAYLPRLLAELLQLTADLWEAQAEYHHDAGWAGCLPDALQYYASDGGQVVRPSLGLKKLETKGSAAMSDVSEAGAFFELLLWDLPDGLELDKPETITGPWAYAPSAKFERLLRAAKVPIGLLTNRDVLRLMYAPAGESTGFIDFRVADMATVGGRPILDALMMLLNAHRFFGVAPEMALPALLHDSRKYQADVTVTLGKQVLEALTILLRGFEAAAARDGGTQLEAALARADDHVYHGLLTVLLRVVFVLYAEDRELLPVEHPLYAKHYSLFALFAELQADHGAYPDSMPLRFGAWGRIVALFRALFLGVKNAELKVPERRGALFNPNTFAFLEGWDAEGSAPVRALRAQSEVLLPTLDDETVFLVLSKLILLDGQRLSYRALDVEQIGSVYEGLMGYHVKRVSADAVCTRPDGVWLSADEALAV